MKKSRIALLGFNLLLTAFCFSLNVLPLSAKDAAEKIFAEENLKQGQIPVISEAQENGHKWLKARAYIKASPHIVWESVHEERKHDPDMSYSKVIEQNENKATLEQKFVVLPVIGTAICLMHNDEVPLQRINYHLIKSDHFKALEGSWVLYPADNGKATILELSSYLDVGIPFSRPIIDTLMPKKMQRRLENVRKTAEKYQPQTAGNITIK